MGSRCTLLRKGSCRQTCTRSAPCKRCRRAAPCKPRPPPAPACREALPPLPLRPSLARSTPSRMVWRERRPPGRAKRRPANDISPGENFLRIRDFFRFRRYIYIYMINERVFTHCDALHVAVVRSCYELESWLKIDWCSKHGGGPLLYPFDRLVGGYVHRFLITVLSRNRA